MSRSVVIVAHTHWDREWYSSFQTFRLRLVDLLDGFLPHLARDETYRHFLLDGQVAVVDDYLAVRPQAEPTLRELAAAGRLSMGPWYTQPDEFLVSGETLIRNLRLGITRAEEYQALMPVGYLPDMFGHIAQMPQILAGFGFEHAVVWRGVPAAITASGFWWEAPNGSRIRAEHLLGGYFNAHRISPAADDLVSLTRRYERQHGDELKGPLLLMNGMDHQVPQTHLGSTVAAANATQDKYQFEIAPLTAYLRNAPTADLDVWRGEMRSGARSNLLMGVASNRVDVRDLAARAERALERYAEPLAALFAPRWPERELDIAWRQLILNSAHDSICACSADEVVRAVVSRYEEAIDIALGLGARSLDAFAADLADPGWFALNVGSCATTAVVEIDVPGDSPPDNSQPLATRSAVLFDLNITGAELRGYLAILRSQEFITGHFVNEYSIDTSGPTVEVRFAVHPTLLQSLDVASIRREVTALIDEDPDRTFHLVAEQAPSVRALVQTPSIPSFGWARLGDTPDGALAASIKHPVRVDVAPDRITLHNGRVTVVIDKSTGTFHLDDTGPHGVIVESGDAGDTYNYSPPDHDSIVRDAHSTECEVIETGPLRALVHVVRHYSWPTHEVAQVREGSSPISVEMSVELRADEPFVRLATAWGNSGFRDHRVRIEFATVQSNDNEAPTHSLAESTFAIVRRGLTAEGGSHERALPTFPATRFVSVGDITIAHDRVTEYEVAPDGRSVALTLLRATAWLSRAEMSYRPLPAGPAVRLEGSQMQVPTSARLCLAARGSIDPVELAERAWIEPHVVVAPGGGTRAATGQALPIRGEVVISAVERVDGVLTVRVFNPTPASVALELTTPWRRVDLRNRPTGEWAEPATQTVSPDEIASFQFKHG